MFKYTFICNGTLHGPWAIFETISLFQPYHLWVTVSQVARFGPWVSVWLSGTRGRGEGEVGPAEEVGHTGRAHRESKLSTLESEKGNVAWIVRLPRRRWWVTDKTSVISIVFYPQKASSSAGVSMNFSGKLTLVLLLVLLAAQGKTQRAVSRCFAGKKK